MQKSHSQTASSEGFIHSHSGVTGPAATQREIPRLVDEQEACLERLHNTVDDLAMQLDQCLRDSEPAEQNGEAKAALETTYGRRLSTHNDAITAAVNKILDLQRRLEL